jgi:glucokinase
MSSLINRNAGWSAIVVAALGVSGCATTPPEEDPVVQKLTELEGRLLRIERVLSNQSLLDLSQRIEAAQNENRTLRGQVEELQHGSTRSAEQQRQLYADIDRRLQALESGSGAVGTPCLLEMIERTIRLRSIC